MLAGALIFSVELGSEFYLKMLQECYPCVMKMET